MPSHYIELTVATTQYFARSVFVEVAKWEVNWAQAEDEVYNEQSEVIRDISCTFWQLSLSWFFHGDLATSVLSSGQPKTTKGEKLLKHKKFKSYWSRWINIKGLTADISYPSQPTVIVEWILPCCDSSNFHHLFEVQWFLCCLFWTSVQVQSISSEVWLWACCLLVLGAS